MRPKGAHPKNHPKTEEGQKVALDCDQRDSKLAATRSTVNISLFQPRLFCSLTQKTNPEKILHAAGETLHPQPQI